MKLRFITFLMISGFLIYACSSTKKTTTTASSEPKKAVEATLSPGDAEVKAILPRFSDVTLQTLNDGYAVYTGPCTNCHGQKKIFSRSEESWQKSIDRMAPKAHLTDQQKDALWKYILAMKASRGEAGK